MKQSHIALLVVRLVAFYLAVMAAVSATGLGVILIQTPNSDNMTGSWVLGSGVTIALQCLLAWIVYASAPRIAGEFGGERATEPIEDRLAIGRLALRIAGILIVDQAFHYLPWMVEVQWFDGLSIAPMRMAFLTVLLLCLAGIGVLLYWQSRPLARRLFGTAADLDQPASTLAQAIGFSVLGAWVVVGTVPELIQQLFNLIARSDPYQFGLTSAVDNAHFAADVIRFTIGLVLFLSGGVLARAWHRLRTAGLPRTSQPEP